MRGSFKKTYNGTFSLLEAIKKFSKSIKKCRLVHVSTKYTSGSAHRNLIFKLKSCKIQTKNKFNLPI